LKGVDLEVAPGEIVGLTGLIGSGYEDLTAFAFGARRASAGVMQVDGAQDLDLRAMAPRDAMARGVAFVPADRPSAGVVGRLSITDNMMLPSLGAYFVGGRLRRRRMAERARELGKRFDVRPNDPDQILGALSGGNAQKVVIARWLGRAPRLFLLDEPTQGVDVGARGQILAALREQAQEGLSVVVSSSDYEQLAIICDRVLVFRRGAIHRTLHAPGLTKEAIAAACYLDGESSEG
jgi:ribose transport system ATP-binding protein